ncbi:MAG: type II toxin-antitoxin system RelB/DinJ family antitoxin [Patescibacteria group bacterium]
MTTLQIRIDEKTKRKAKKTLENLGLDISSGVKLFLEQVITTQSIPFSAVTPVEHKLRYGHIYRKEIDDMLKNGKRYKTVEEAFSDILKEK